MPLNLVMGIIVSIGLRHFREVQSKAIRAYAQSGQYHTIVESRVQLTGLALGSLSYIFSQNIFHEVLCPLSYIFSQNIFHEVLCPNHLCYLILQE